MAAGLDRPVTDKEAWDALGTLELYCRQHAKNCMGCRFEDSRGCHMRNTVTMFTSELVGGISDMEAVLMAKALREYCGKQDTSDGHDGCQNCPFGEDNGAFPECTLNRCPVNWGIADEDVQKEIEREEQDG